MLSFLKWWKSFVLWSVFGVFVVFGMLLCLGGWRLRLDGVESSVIMLLFCLGGWILWIDDVVWWCCDSGLVGWGC